MRSAALFLLFFALWLAWSGLYKPLLVGLGVTSCLLCVWLTRRMHEADTERFRLGPGLRALRYLPWLVKEIALSNWQAIRIVLSPGLPIDPVVLKITASQQSDLGRVIYGNSITLTPGTLTMDVDGDQVTVHALRREGADALEAGEMNARVAWLERGR